MNITKYNKPIFGDLTVITDDNGDSWFIGNEVGEMLELSNIRRDIGKYVKDSQKMPLRQLSGCVQIGTLELNQSLTVINEAGLYGLVMKSRAPKAAIFQDWVTEEVLPSIRKTGSYNQPNKPISRAELLVEQAQALLAQERATAQAQETADEAHRRIDDLERDHVPLGYGIVSAIGRHYGLSTQKASELVSAYDVQTRPITVNRGSYPILTKMVAIDDFKNALKQEIEALNLSESGLWLAGGRIGRFSAKGRVLELFNKCKEARGESAEVC
ncbi:MULTISPECIES: Bro-N domain-containing protein [Vibrio harveyi group]|uniref:BRO-N domain-containing protein n=1 Tax=Vibrio harveyi group TaxID=717610 RepID=UPI001486E194|nr:Bro-N domain-containing protein [Vibrio parahaemolyticus]MDG2761588.1 Bro-N domain-containing protein [Vibrio parahaemolyticus]